MEQRGFFILPTYPMMGYQTALATVSGHIERSDLSREYGNQSCFANVETILKLIRSLSPARNENSQKYIDCLKNVIQQSKENAIVPAFRALNNFVCALRRHGLQSFNKWADESPVAQFGRGDDAKLGPFAISEVSLQVISLPARFALNGLVGWIPLAHEIGHTILEGQWFGVPNLRAQLFLACYELHFNSDQKEVVSHFLDRFKETAADVLSVWLFGKCAALGFIPFMRSNTPWFCEDLIPQEGKPHTHPLPLARTYILAAAVKQLLGDQETANWILKETLSDLSKMQGLVSFYDGNRKWFVQENHDKMMVVADRLVDQMIKTLDQISGGRRCWNPEDDKIVKGLAEAFKSIGNGKCNLEEMNFGNVTPLHKVAAAFYASLELPEEPPQTFVPSQFGYIQGKASEEGGSYAAFEGAGEVAPNIPSELERNHNYTNRIFKAMIDSLQ